MIRICKKCDEQLDNECILCPKCKTLTSVLEELDSRASGVQYEDWDSPSPRTIYCKMYNISFPQFKYDMGRGVSPVVLRQIERRLEDREYNCGVCSYNLDGFCTRKSCLVSPDAICRSFEVQRKSTSRQHRIPPWYSPK